jgi:hypothetical protein
MELLSMKCTTVVKSRNTCTRLLATNEHQRSYGQARICKIFPFQNAVYLALLFEYIF